MLSIGIRCGQGFDRQTLRKLIEVGKRPHEFDILILGNNAGGLTCAREAVQHGKKVAMVHWRIPTPGEEEGRDEDRQHMAEALYMNRNYIIDRTHEILEQEAKTQLMPVVKIIRPVTSRSTTPGDIQTESKIMKWSRKVRGTRLDLANAVTNMSVEGLMYMHEIAATNDVLRTKGKSGRVVSWRRMMEHLLDYIIQRNWAVQTDFLRDRVSLYNGFPVITDEHTVEVLRNKGEDRTLTAETIISALEVRNTFPKDVAGAEDYGVNLDDFFRLSTPPGKTLIVGAGPRGMECAGILASFGFPVVVVDRTSILRRGDPEIVGMIVNDLTQRGVTFMEKKTLVSVRKKKTGESLIAEFFPGDSSMQSLRKKYTEEFDTVLFTMKEKLDLKNGKTALQFEVERLTGEMYYPEENVLFESVIVIPDRPSNVAVTQLIGKHVAGQLLDVEECPPKLRFVPNIVLTPFEYAYVGLPENTARRRFGDECIQVFSGYIPTEDVLVDADDVKDEVCFAKVLTIHERDIVVGLHLFGMDAVRVTNKVMEPIKGKMLVSDLHPTLGSLVSYPGEWDEGDNLINE